MNGKFLAGILILTLVISSLTLAGCAPKEEGNGAAVYEAFKNAVDMEFALQVATELSENSDYHSQPLGSRNAGSDAEHAAADYIAGVMEEIGLADVEKVPISVDKWSNNGSTFTIGGDAHKFKVNSYASGATPKEGVTAEILFLDKGTMQDYEGVDADGKIILVNVDQRADWWITYPTLEAEFQGAAAIMLANTGGFSEVSEDALNSNDFCGPVSIPSASISQADSKYIQGLLEKGPVMGTLKVDNEVKENGGTSYNVMGFIKGKNSDEQIVIGSHYDTYFSGFQDNSCAVAFDLAIAKAMIDSGYQPERDIVFISHGSEEWGKIGTQFDWSTGAYGQVSQAHPEWAGKTLAFINSELPAYEFGETTRSDTAPELYTFIKHFVESDFSVQPEGVFPSGIYTGGTQTYTYSDDFSYYSAGIPSIINGFLWNDDGDDVWDFYYKYYHTDYDTKDIYNEEVLKFNIMYYGGMAMFLDQTPMLDLDYTNQYNRLAEALDEGIATEAGADVAGYKKALEEYGKAAKAAYDKVVNLNNSYSSLVAGGASEEELTAAWEETRTANALALEIFKDTQDAFLALMYERPVVGHEAPQENIGLMQQCIAGLKEGKINEVVDEYAWKINNVNEWYSYYFSPEVTGQFTEMFADTENLQWGTDRMVEYANVEAATRSLFGKYDTTNSSFDKEMGIYEGAIKNQQQLLVKNVADEITAMKELTAKLNDLAGSITVEE